MADINVVMDKLESFETADDIAEFFRGYGIKAQPQNADTCAMTKFVMEETGLENVSTTIYHIFANTVPAAGFTYNNTDAMQLFVRNYDKGVYPDLIEEGYELSKYGCTCCKEAR